MPNLTDVPPVAMPEPWKHKDKIENNPVRLPKRFAAEIAEHLDAHVSSLFVLFHQYQKHHWLVEGPQFRELHKFLEKSYKNVHEHADTLAERMTALGAVPTCSPARQASLSYLSHEPEGVFRIRDMLSADRELEGHTAERIRTTIELATSSGDFATETLLKRTLVDVEERAHELDHFLGLDTLTLWRASEGGEGIAEAAVSGAAQGASS